MHRWEAWTPNPARDRSTKPWFLASILITLFLAGLLVWYLAFTFNFVSTFKNQELAGERASWKLLLYSETMNMATRSSTLSGNLKWKQTYSKTKSKMDNLLNDTREMIDSREIRGEADELRSSYDKVTQIQEQAFTLVSNGNKKEAARLLAGWPYIKNSMRLESSARELVDLAQKRITRKTSFQRMQAGIVLTVIAICLLVLILSWFMTIRFWRRQFERKKQAEDALLESEKKYRTIIETASSGCWQLDADEITVDVNQALCDMLGYSKEEILGKMPFDFVDEANDPIFRDNVARTAPSVNRNYDVDLIRKNGDTVSARMDSTTLYDELGAVAGSFAFVTDITKRKRAEEKLKEMSLYDSLTGLFNRNFFEEEMTRLRDGGSSPVGIVICDLDGLKFINDTLGHQSGDQMLMNAAELLQNNFRSTDIMARIGGDEFAILFTDTNQEMVERMLQRFRQSVHEYNNTDPEIPLSISVGCAVSETPVSDMHDLFSEADNRMYREKIQREGSARSAVLQALTGSMQARDFDTEGHCDRLHELVDAMARDLALSQDAMNDLSLFARFHDLGKVGIPDNILFKTGALTEEEWQHMRRHCEIGHRIASSVPDLEPIADYILKHHEWWDGQGYPLGLSGRDIPLPCRILSVVDAYDAMTSDRPYRKAMTREEALAELKRCAGTQFDPELVEQFSQLLERADSE